MQEMTRSKMKLAFLLLIAFVPITLATFAFRSASEAGFFSGTVNRGNLINPPADVTDLDMHNVAGQPVFKSFEEMVAELENGQSRLGGTGAKPATVAATANTWGPGQHQCAIICA